MTKKYSFTSDTEADEFVTEIIAEMVTSFGISREEALGRIQRHWLGQIIGGSNEIVYHEKPDFWANEIYWDVDRWWLDTNDRVILELPPLKPKPWP